MNQGLTLEGMGSAISAPIPPERMSLHLFQILLGYLGKILIEDQHVVLSGPLPVLAVS